MFSSRIIRMSSLLGFILLSLLTMATTTPTAHELILPESMTIYTTKIVPIPGVENTNVTGTVVVMTTTTTTTTTAAEAAVADDPTATAVAATAAPLFYGGFLKNLQPNLIGTSPDCTTAVNGCGLHIHQGTSCQDSEVQGGHYFNASVVGEDPWTTARYSSDSKGSAIAGTVLQIGTNDVVGRAVVVHAQDGSRVGCGLLQPVDTTAAAQEEDLLILHTHTVPLSSSSSTAAAAAAAAGEGEVVVVGNLPSLPDDHLCYMGYARGLALNVRSVFATTTVNGTDCTNTNGCGTHIHAGTSCENTKTQGGHWYDQTADDGIVDPWALLGYEYTSSTGDAWYGTCLQVEGLSSSESELKPFVVHDEDGSRIACGVLKAATAPEDGGEPEGESSSAPDNDGNYYYYSAMMPLLFGTVLAYWM